jgi:excisionase family DNA binding protein
MITEHVECDEELERPHCQTDTILQLNRKPSFTERQSKLQLLSVEQVAKLLGVSAGWVRDHATRKQPHLRCVKVGKLLKFRPDDIEGFIDEWCR